MINKSGSSYALSLKVWASLNVKLGKATNWSLEFPPSAFVNHDLVSFNEGLLADFWFERSFCCDIYDKTLSIINFPLSFYLTQPTSELLSRVKHKLTLRTVESPALAMVVRWYYLRSWCQTSSFVNHPLDFILEVTSLSMMPNNELAWGWRSKLLWVPNINSRRYVDTFRE